MDLDGKQIHSPVYPKSYPSNVDCAWVIPGIKGKVGFK